jgi:endoglucanase
MIIKINLIYNQQTMKHILVSLVMFIGILMSLSIQAQPVKIHGALSVKGTQMTDEHGAPAVLNGVSFGWHNWWPRFYTPETVKWLANDWKCSVVRAAMGVDPKSGYIDNPAW